MSSKKSRRQYLQILGGTGGLVLAGCTGTTSDGGGGGGGTNGAGTVNGNSGSNSGSGSSNSPLSMGSILPVTGEYSDFGEGQQRAVNLAVKDVNAAGGPLDREIRMSNKDSQFEVQAATSKYQSLINSQDTIGIVGPAISGIAVTLGKRAADDNVMLVSPWATTPLLSTIGWENNKSIKYVGRTWAAATQAGLAMATVINDNMDGEKAGVLYADNTYGTGVANELKKSYENVYNKSFQSFVSFSTNTSNYGSALDELFSGGVEKAALIAPYKDGVSVLTQWSNGGYNGNWVLDPGQVNEKLQQGNLKDITNSVYLVNNTSSKSKGTSKFRQRMGESFISSADATYDALFLQALALEKGGKASAKSIAKHIRSVSRPPGTTITINEFAKAKRLLANGKQINYQGAHGAVDLNKQLEPVVPYAVLQATGGTLKKIDRLPVSFFKKK